MEQETCFRWSGLEEPSQSSGILDRDMNDVKKEIMRIFADEFSRI
jgi:hypothetical protein